MRENTKIKGQLRFYLQWPLILSVFLMAANLVVGAISPKAGFAMSGFTLLYVVVALWLFLYRRKRLMGGLVEFSAEYAGIQKQLLSEMAMPYAIADAEGHLIWMNKAFADVVQEDKGCRKSLAALFPEITKEMLDEIEGNSSIHSSFDGKFYRVDIRQIYVDENEGLRLDLNQEIPEEMLLAVYLFDETEVLSYKREIDNQKLVAGLIYLDNYEEALESVEEVRRSLLSALIDRKINKYISNMDGIVKKLEKDKYLFVIKQQYTEEIQENRFNLLEDVKTVNIGNEMAVTLSIGMGMNGSSYITNYEYARTAIDMALGRGGDQAVVKDGARIRYYGGKSQQLEKTTRVKARVKAHAMRELMDTKDKLLIMGHKIGDIDSFGAAIGIYRIATSFNKKARIVVNSVNSSVKPMMARFQNNPDYPDDLLMTGEEASDWADANTMLVVVDVNRPSIAEAPELLKQIKTIVVLDHHRQSSEIIDNAVLSYVEPYASSTCEMVAEVLQYIGDGIKIKPAEADAMYAGIVIDTNNFMNQAGVRTFEAAAFLRRNGADVVRVRKLFRDKLEDYKARAEAIQKAEIFKDYFAISECPAEGIESPTVVGAQAANEMLDIVGIKASFVLTELGDTIYFSARSIDEINVQIMMEKLGGGGHRTIAGAQLKDATIEEAKDKLKEIITVMLEKGDI
ncbi:DHH family phosphoesterase [[Clostridium] symbiosum]|uniref:DHH family phosphoesterase n=1 Tax=Clostridium symbiosum TaxID=1512 RepID=UPI001D06D405|nr:DHH family phosphoesterase [[Clostridium] symbiosum]MCB6609196.1 DHH family phosphoesterase [[Clostridium] symbiosum]MCB6933079.1 DHH family phosphoesterase [[Clostridium] symbiosum]